MSEEQKKNTPDDLTKTTDENKVELNEEELGKVSGGPTAVEYNKIKTAVIAII